MPDQLQLRGGTTTEHNSFTGAAREVTVDTTKKTLVVHDGSQAGGTPLMKESGTVDPTTIAIGTGGTQRLAISNSEVVFNETGADVDFRIEGDSNANLFKVDAGNDRIGVGVATPANTFHVHGDGTLRISSAAGANQVESGRIRLTENITDFQGAYIHYDGNANKLHIGTHSGNTTDAANDIDCLTILRGGTSIGLGTDDPQTQIHAKKTGGCVIRLEDSTDNNYSHIFNTSDDLFISADRNGTGAGNLIFRNNGTNERMRIDSSGRLLIGTTTNTFTGVGSSRLQISGTGADTAGANFIRTSNDGGGSYLQFTKNRGSATQSGDTVGAISWMGHDGTDTESYFAQILVKSESNATNNNTQGSIRFGTSNGSSVTTERMRLTPAGNLGIGTQSPSEKLDVNGAIQVTGVVKVTGTTPGIRFTDSDASGGFGHVGVNNTSGSLVMRSDDGNSLSNSYMGFEVDSGEKMRIGSNGNVAIGTTTTTMNASGLKVYHATQPGIQLQNSNSGTAGSDGAEITLTNGGTLLIGNREAGNRVGIQTVATGGSTLVEVARFEQDKKCSFNGSNTTACDIDIEGQVIEIGNPLGNNVSAGQVPVFRAEASNSNKNIVFSSMWGGDNAIHKHMEFTGGSNVFYVGTDDSEIARTTGEGFVVGSTTFSDAHNTDDGIALKKAGNLIARCSTSTNNVLFTAKTIDTGAATALKVLSAQTQVGSVSFNSGGTSFNTSSDYRRKENIVDLTGAITRLKTLLPKRFNFKDESNVTRDGFLAHEVTTVPEAVTGIKDAIATEDDVAKGQAFAVGDPIYQQLDQSKLVPLLVAAVKELITKVEALEAA